jgi:transposase
MLDTETGEAVNLTLMHEGNNVREFYSSLPRPVLVGIEATGSMHWFLNLMGELEIECRVGHPAQVRAAEPRKQKHDRRDAELILKLLAENRFPAIWLANKELLDLRALLLHRHQWVRMRTRMQNSLQAIALANGLRRGPSLWSYDGQAKIAFLPLMPHGADRRNALQTMYQNIESEIEKLNQQVAEQAESRSGARRLMTHPGVSTAANWFRKVWGRHAWLWHASWGSGCGSCCGMRLIIRSSVVADRGNKVVRPVVGMPETGNGANSHRPVD